MRLEPMGRKQFRAGVISAQELAAWRSLPQSQRTTIRKPGGETVKSASLRVLTNRRRGSATFKANRERILTGQKPKML